MSRALMAFVASIALAATACGSAPAAGTTSAPPASATSTVSAGPAPSPSPSPALTFKLNPVAGSGPSGSILLFEGAGTFTVELVITGLQADSSHVSHVHVGSCAAPGGIKFALNQVNADATGAADTRTTVPAGYPPATGHWYVVVHAGPDMQGPNAKYLLCGNLF